MLPPAADRHHLWESPAEGTTALSRSLQEESAAIAGATQRLDSDQVDAVLFLLDACRNRRAKLVITGVGKSDMVARKIAATFSSIGLTAVFLNPEDALPGDLGIVNRDVGAFLHSNSGETDEHHAILPHLKRRGASTTVAMVIGDALAAVWMGPFGISAEQFDIDHPAGSLCRQLTLTVVNLMVPASDLTPLSPNPPPRAVIANLTKGASRRESLETCWVQHPTDPRLVSGIITDDYLRRALKSNDPGS